MGAGVGSSADAAGMNAMGPQPQDINGNLGFPMPQLGVPVPPPQDISGNLGPSVPQLGLPAGPPPPDISGVYNSRPGLAALQAQAPQAQGPQGPSTLNQILQNAGQFAKAWNQNAPKQQAQQQQRPTPINFTPAAMPYVPAPTMMNPNFYGG